MAHDDPDFINCAMSALEEGIGNTEEIMLECACRLGLAETEEPQTTTEGD